MRSTSLAGALARGLRLVGTTALVCAVLFAALITFEYAWRREADVLSGVPRIVDGDTIVLADVNVRLAGLDAPERSQLCLDARGDDYACGQAATDYLTFLIDGGEATCRGYGTDRYGRMIGECRANGVNLSEAMVRRGWAVAYLGDLNDVEAEARELGVGMWAGEFERPDAWRRQRRTADLGLSFGAVRDAARGIALTLGGVTVPVAPVDE